MAIITNRRRSNLVALSLVAPFLVAFTLFFLYPFYRVVQMSFTDAPLLGGGEWVGLANYAKLLSDKLFYTSIVNNAYFVLLTVIPTTAIALGIALMVNRLKGRLQAFVLVIFFLPYVLPVSVVTEIWLWMLDFQYGILQPVFVFFTGKPVAVFRNPYWVMPTIAALTIWWTNGFNVLLFIAGLRNISAELYEAAALDGATPAPAVLARDLAAPLAGHGARPDAAAHPAAQALRPGLPDQQRRPVQLLLRAPALPLPRGLPAQPRRLRLGGRHRARGHHRGHLGAAVPAPAGQGGEVTGRRVENTVLTVATLIAAAAWFFPLYWAMVTSLRTDESVVAGAGLIPDQFQLGAFASALFNTRLLTWYLNSIVTAVVATAIVIVCGMMCAYAISQLRFPGRRLLYGTILVSFMIPIPALYVAQFVLMNDLGWINTWAGIIAPQLIVPVVIIVYKQFFDAVPKEMREAAILDGGGEYTLLFRVYLPLNWGITTALAIITFIGAWNNFWWPFLVVTSEDMMTIPVGITQVQRRLRRRLRPHHGGGTPRRHAGRRRLPRSSSAASPRR